ncbi:MAG: BlaI family penicillinase repressor [Limisphaerales bacterium]|jgi:BlaI family penicillinase repressor
MQIMDVLYAQEEASAAQIQTTIPDALSYSAVRALIKKLIDKRHVTYRQQGSKYIYTPVLPKSYDIKAIEKELRKLKRS